MPPPAPTKANVFRNASNAKEDTASNAKDTEDAKEGKETKDADDEGGFDSPPPPAPGLALVPGAPQKKRGRPRKVRVFLKMF